jgi:hypothetical protein
MASRGDLFKNLGRAGGLLGLGAAAIGLNASLYNGNRLGVNVYISRRRIPCNQIFPF